VAGIRGLFVRKSGVYGTTPVAARKDIAGLVASTAAFGARPGVISGCVVSGTTSGWTYSVSAGHLVTVRSAADGAMPWGNDAAATVATSAAPASGSRIDLITAYHNDVDNGDGDNDPVLGVVQGTAGSPGVAPSLPTGAIELGRCTLTSGASNTQGGTFSSASVQYTSSRGGPIPVTGLTQRTAMTSAASLTNPVTVYRLDTGAVQRNVGAGWFVVDDGGAAWTPYTPTVSGWTLGNGVLDCAYRACGRLVVVRIRLRVGTTTAWPGGGLTFTPPLPAQSTVRQYGSGAAIGNVGTERYPLTIELGVGGSFVPLYNSGSKGLPLTLATAAPVTWAEADSVYGNITYEAASLS